ncbi:MULTISPECIES: adenylosuccinate lyase [Aequorivita]|uniref:Adenylosuccinate lyase n=1 Tax=Aequorivita iocasae TaxID=2803865 RepID=A0ABX7DQL5_9FLAO|nr:MULTISPECIES: adenylosuccinate lyase [Aequorivita]QQX75737.1 adenylosuccinate lyase [Aequorivita iocasae]UCA55196.1 adenylosuccinate lyase [Aequorivita sp. F7]
MLPEDLKQKLMEVDSSKTKRVEIAMWVTKKTHYVRETLQWCFAEDSELLVQSAWVLEIICEYKAKNFFKYMHLFFEKLPTIKNDSALRSCAKICEMLCHYHFMKSCGVFYEVLNKNERKIITECCFDWLITDQKVACQAPAMQCLYYLGWDNDKIWIYPELRDILITNAPHKSAGYQARARKILKKIS